MAANEADRNKLHQICDLSYKAQAVWFLNGFWDTHQSEAEKFWAYVHKANAIDLEKHESGCALDELNAHRLLEMFDETLTVREMRTQLRSVGAIGEKEHPKLVPLAHLLLARYKVDWHHFVNAPQGNQEEIDRAQAQLDACKAAFEESNRRAAEAAEALLQAEQAEAEAKRREEAARQAEAAAKSREAAAKASAEEAARREAASKAAAADLAAKEAELRAAQAALDAALAEVQREEDAYNARTAELKAKSETGGTVSMNRAKNELAQHLAGETLPLKKAKITAEAAAKRNERAVAAAATARQAADAAAHEASQARHAADEDARAATAARQAAEQAAAQATAARQAAEHAAAQATAARQAAEQAAAQATAARQAAEQAAAQATAARQEAERRRQAAAQAKTVADEALARAEAALAEAEAYMAEVNKNAGGGKGALWWIERELHEQKKYLPTSRGGIAKH
jgi:hypothetical protein